MDLKDYQIAEITGYAATVKQTFAAEFVAAGNRFTQGQILLDRFDAATESVLQNGSANLRALDEAHNELCIAGSLLSTPVVKFNLLEYEPPLAGCAKTIDFRATADEEIAYIDVKTIKPLTTDRWEQFERALAEGWLPDNVTVGLSKPWLGGEIWHAWFASRSRMLEHTVEFEAKIAQARLGDQKTLFTLAFCGDGFVWRHDHLQDFVAFYASGMHRADDPFSKAEQNYISQTGISLTRSVSRFAYLRRPRWLIRPNRIDWHVRAPKDFFAVGR